MHRNTDFLILEVGKGKNGNRSGQKFGEAVKAQKLRIGRKDKTIWITQNVRSVRPKIRGRNIHSEILDVGRVGLVKILEWKQPKNFWSEKVEGVELEI